MKVVRTSTLQRVILLNIPLFRSVHRLLIYALLDRACRRRSARIAGLAKRHKHCCSRQLGSAYPRIVHMLEQIDDPSHLNEQDGPALAQSFRAHIDDPGFPCVGAKSALARGNLCIVAGWRIDSAWDDLRLHDRLVEWSNAYEADEENGLRSLAMIFSGPLILDETQFEEAMWRRLQSLTDKDAWRGQNYDTHVKSDPDDPHFSLSFGGQAYFVVGMHPNASRPARRAPTPALVFNLHDQFEKLRAGGLYERMRKRILERDEKLAGSPNPMLTRHGEASEARQYSGRLVGDEWRCPFTDPRATRSY